jgi:hypothetical protein
VDLNNPTLPTLVVTGGAQHGAFYTVESLPAEVIVGSGTTAGFRLSGEQVDATHIQVTWDVRGLTLRDLGSAAGTFVNGQPVQEQIPLRDGDRVTLGAPGGRGSVKLLVRVPAYVGTLQGVPGLQPGDPLSFPKGAPSTASEGFPGATSSTPYHGIDLEAATGGFGDLPETMVGMAPPPIPDTEPAPSPKSKVPMRSLAILAAGLAAVAVAAYLAWLWLQPKPAIEAAQPAVVQPGQTLTITASNLDAAAESNVVTIGGVAGQVASASADQLVVKVPAGIPPGPAQLVVVSGGTPAGNLTLTVVPTPSFTGLDPDVAMPGDEVQLLGKNLDPLRITVTIADKTVPVVAAEDRSVRVRIPAEIAATPGKSLLVVVKTGGAALAPHKVFLGKLPFVREVKPTAGLPGTKVTIQGAGFDAAPEGNKVLFGGRPAVVLAASTKQLTVVAPDAGDVPDPSAGLVVESKAGTTDVVPFDLRRPSMNTFEPYFYPVPAPAEAGEGKVVVATAIAPFALLSGKGDAPSVAERAVRLSTFLNELVAAAKTSAIALEAKGGDPPGVGVTGRGAFVVVTPEDAAGYASAYTGLRGAPSQAALARHWAVVLDDYVTLFVRNERPLKAIAVTPKAKVLLDLYTDGSRAGGRGVPMALLSPATPALARSLKELSLFVTGGGGSSTIALTGEWTGTMQDGAGPRQIRVRFGSGRGGVFTTMVGSASVDSPLTSVGVAAGGGVVFSVQIRGTQKRFNGKLEGETLRGSVQSKDGTGSFALDLAK